MGIYTSGTVHGAYAAAQTNTELVAAPGAGRSIVIDWVTIGNGATAGEVKLIAGSGGATVWGGFFAVNTPWGQNFKPAIKLAANTALDLTSVTVTTHRVNVGYHIENA